MSLRQVESDDARKAFTRDRPFSDPTPAIHRLFHRLREGLVDEVSPRLEMKIEATMRQAGRLHQLGDLDAFDTPLANASRCVAHNPSGRFGSMTRFVTHNSLPYETADSLDQPTDVVSAGLSCSRTFQIHRFPDRAEAPLDIIHRLIFVGRD